VFLKKGGNEQIHHNVFNRRGHIIGSVGVAVTQREQQPSISLHQADTITVCSFNIQFLGSSKKETIPLWQIF
jgi:hypothetical protein